MNRIYSLNEINRRERELADRKARLYIGVMLGLGAFMIFVAIVAGAA